MRHETLTACRVEGRTCAACCHGDRVARPALTARLRHQTRLARAWARRPHPPPRWRLLLHELRARPPWQLVWALLLLVPLVGDWLRPQLRRQLACAFLGFEGRDGSRVGCLLHPSRWGGVDLRRSAAFALLRGFGCGGADYLCLAAHALRRAGWREQAWFLRATRGLGWYDYGRAVARFVRPRPRRPSDA